MEDIGLNDAFTIIARDCERMVDLCRCVGKLKSRRKNAVSVNNTKLSKRDPLSPDDSYLHGKCAENVLESRDALRGTLIRVHTRVCGNESDNVLQLGLRTLRAATSESASRRNIK